jgi:hypothetical protein
MKTWNPVKAIYEKYLKGLKQMVPGQTMPNGKTIEEEIKRVKALLKTME